MVMSMCVCCCQLEAGDVIQAVNGVPVARFTTREGRPQLRRGSRGPKLAYNGGNLPTNAVCLNSHAFEKKF